MIKVTPKRVGILCWILKNKDSKWSIHQIYRELGNPWYSSTHLFIKELERAGYVRKVKGGYKVMDVQALINQIALIFPFKAKEKQAFYLNKKRQNMNLIKEISLDHAFTLFSAGELMYSYVMTEKTHVYIRKNDLDNWKKELIQKGARRASEEEGNILLLPIEEDYPFKLSEDLHGHRIAPYGLVIADLISFGGLGEEHGRLILEDWLKK